MVFEGLCERMLSAMCLLQTSVSEVSKKDLGPMQKN